VLLHKVHGTLRPKLSLSEILFPHSLLKPIMFNQKFVGYSTVSRCDTNADAGADADADSDLGRAATVARTKPATGCILNTRCEWPRGNPQHVYE